MFKFSWVTILQGVEFPIFILIFAWALQQCSAKALPVIGETNNFIFGTQLGFAKGKNGHGPELGQPLTHLGFP